jgi:hypothetical protein
VEIRRRVVISSPIFAWRITVHEEIMKSRKRLSRKGFLALSGSVSGGVHLPRSVSK